jgi:NUMOD3 motif/GIY-YIG catalytic domain
LSDITLPFVLKMAKKFHFVYITTNIVNGKQYVGDHSTNNLERDKYLGSGVYLREALNEYGIKNFKREILELFDTKEAAFNAQEKYIQKFNTLSPNGYNISLKGGYGISSSYLNEETKAKIGEKNKGEKNGMWRKKVSKETIDKWRKSHEGYKHSQDTKNKQRNAHLGKNNPMYGKPAWHAINIIKKKCEYCGFETTPGNYGKWHGNRCKHKI